jgi:hypothetical protein
MIWFDHVLSSYTWLFAFRFALRLIVASFVSPIHVTMVQATCVSALCPGFIIVLLAGDCDRCRSADGAFLRHSWFYGLREMAFCKSVRCRLRYALACRYEFWQASVRASLFWPQTLDQKRFLAQHMDLFGLHPVD